MAYPLIRTLRKARYSPDNIGHFGLASKCYTHFTSPIRRYPDLFIHRIISEYLEKGYNLSEDRLNYLYKKAEKYAKRSSECEKIAVKAERDGEAKDKLPHPPQHHPLPLHPLLLLQIGLLQCTPS